MIDVNLLGEKNKKIWIAGNVARILITMAFAAAFIILALSAALAAYNYKLLRNADISKEKLSGLQEEETEQEEKLKKEIEKINAKISYFGGILEDNKNVSGSLEDLAEISGSDISISSIDIQSENRKISVKGSGSRLAFLRFQSLMEQSGSFFNIHSPLSNITKKENIEFSISADIKEEVLKQ